MVLSFVCDQNGLGIEQLMSALGMSHQSVSDCVDRLVDAGLSAWQNGKDGSGAPEQVVPTGAGRKLTRHVLRD